VCSCYSNVFCKCILKKIRKRSATLRTNDSCKSGCYNNLRARVQTDGQQSVYSERKITTSLGNVTVRGGKRWKGQGGSTMAKSLSMYSITENVYYSQLSSVALLLQPKPNCFTWYNTRKGLGSLSLCAIVLRSSPPSHASICNGQRSSQLFCVHYKLRSVCATSFWTEQERSGRWAKSPVPKLISALRSANLYIVDDCGYLGKHVEGIRYVSTDPVLRRVLKGSKRYAQKMRKFITCILQPGAG
jgi:hypothetical protein